MSRVVAVPPEKKKFTPNRRTELKIGLCGAASGALFACFDLKSGGTMSVLFGCVAAVSYVQIKKTSIQSAWEVAVDKAETAAILTVRAARNPVKTSRDAWNVVAKKAHDIRIAHEARWQPAFAPHEERRVRMVPIATGMSAYPLYATLARR